VNVAGKKSGIFGALKLACLIAFFAVYGFVFLCAVFVRFVRRTHWGVKLLKQTVPCLYCHASVPLVGRYVCASPGCGAEYQGFIQRCQICQSGCLWTPCPGCGAAVQVGMRL
jgi:hypothetical protein